MVPRCPGGVHVPHKITGQILSYRVSEVCRSSAVGGTLCFGIGSVAFGSFQDGIPKKLCVISVLG